MVLLGIGLRLARHAGPDMDTPMLVFQTVVLMPESALSSPSRRFVAAGGKAGPYAS